MLLFYVQAAMLPVTLVLLEKSSAHSKLYTDNKRDPGLGVDALREKRGKGSQSLTDIPKEGKDKSPQAGSYCCVQPSK